MRSTTSAQSAQMEVQNVQNYVGGNNIAIFQYYTEGGTQPVVYNAASGTWTYYASGSTSTTVTTSTPLAYNSSSGANAAALAAIDTIKVQLVVQSPYADLKTGAKPIVTLVSTVKVNNCIQSSTGTLSCQN